MGGIKREKGRGIMGDGPLFAPNVFIDWKRLFLYEGRETTLESNPSETTLQKRLGPWIVTAVRRFDIEILSINKADDSAKGRLFEIKKRVLRIFCKTCRKSSTPSLRLIYRLRSMIECV